VTTGPWRGPGAGLESSRDADAVAAASAAGAPARRAPPEPLRRALCAPLQRGALRAGEPGVVPYSHFSRGEARARTVLAPLRAALGRSFVAMLRGRSRSTPPAGEGGSSMASPSRGEALVAAAAAPAGAIAVAKPQEVVVRRPPTVTGPERRRAGLHARACTRAPILIARVASLASMTWTRATATARRTTSCTLTG